MYKEENGFTKKYIVYQDMLNIFFFIEDGDLTPPPEVDALPRKSSEINPLNWF